MFTEGMSQKEIAAVLGVSSERVKQIENTALRKLRHPKFKKEFMEILETVAMLNRSNMTAFRLKGVSSER